MPGFTERELLHIIAAGESDRVEFKESLGGDAVTRIREAICAFANDLAGREKPGLVFVGVKDDGTIGTLAVTDPLLRQLADMKTDGNRNHTPTRVYWYDDRIEILSLEGCSDR